MTNVYVVPVHLLSFTLHTHLHVRRYPDGHYEVTSHLCRMGVEKGGDVIKAEVLLMMFTASST